jgi:nitrile hydratase
MKRPARTAAKKRIAAKKRPAARKPSARRPAARKSAPRKAATRHGSGGLLPEPKHGKGPVAPPLFATGDRVSVMVTHPPGHRRTPYYIRGKTGVVERYCGAFRNPEELAYGFDGEPRRHLYRVRFRQREIWPDYRGPEHDTLDLEVFEHWLIRT